MSRSSEVTEKVILDPASDLDDSVSPSNQDAQIRKLRNRIKTLETQIEMQRDVQEALKVFERRYESLTENIPDVVYSLDDMGIILTINRAVTAFGYKPEELIGESFIDLLHEDDRERVVNAYFELVAHQKDYTRSQQFRIITKAGEVRWFEANCSIRFTPEGQFILQEGVCRDITENMQHQNAMLKTQEDLEEQVKHRTAELTEANAILQKEIVERREMEAKLRVHEADLKLEKANLQETNTALKVLLKRRDVDKRSLQEQVVTNIKKLVLPYVKKMRLETSDERQKALFSIIESNLSDITCGFSRQLSLQFYNLTPSEVKVANFIRQGKKSREIAEVLGLSVRTIEAFRQSLRRKLLIQNKKINLRTFLMSLQ